MYKTNDLALKPYSLQNSGQSIPITAVRRSLEPDKNGRLTFVQNNTQIRTIYFDPVFGSGLNQIVNQPLLNMILPNTTAVVLDAWVFQKIAVVRMNNTSSEFIFYEK